MPMLGTQPGQGDNDPRKKSYSFKARFKEGSPNIRVFTWHSFTFYGLRVSLHLSVHYL